MNGEPKPHLRADRSPRGHPGLMPIAPPRRRKVDCIDFVERITDYLEDAVADDDCAAIDRHLEACADCIRAIEQWRRVIALTGRLGQEDVDAVDAAARDELLAAFRAQPPAP